MNWETLKPTRFEDNAIYFGVRMNRMQFLCRCVSVLVVVVLLLTYICGVWTVGIVSNGYRNQLKFMIHGYSQQHAQEFPTSSYHSYSRTVSVFHTKSSPRTTQDYITSSHHDESTEEVVISSPKVSAVQCSAIIKNDGVEIGKAMAYQQAHSKMPIPAKTYISKASNCPQFLASRQYTLHHLTEEERDFPIAFSLVVFKDVEQIERLLRAIYRPQNYYCIHVDSKSDPEVYEAMKAIAGCLQNVFLTSKRADVQWGWWSVVEPEIICMEDLWKYKKWKYFINLTGQEFPLKTNYELVKILKALKGANNAEGTVRRRNKARTMYIHEGYSMPKDLVRKSSPPEGITLTKGSVHIVAQRGFIDYILHNKTALEFRDWVKNTGVPDETFFTSLSYSPQLNIPGAYIGNPETYPIDNDLTENPFIARFKNWGTWPYNWPCHGERVRMICIFAVGDLPLLTSRRELFANKFYLSYHPLALDCLEEWHFNRTRDLYLGRQEFNDEYYHRLSYVSSHVT